MIRNQKRNRSNPLTTDPNITVTRAEVISHHVICSLPYSKLCTLHSYLLVLALAVVIEERESFKSRFKAAFWSHYLVIEAAAKSIENWR